MKNKILGLRTTSYKVSDLRKTKELMTRDLKKEGAY